MWTVDITTDMLIMQLYRKYFTWVASLYFYFLNTMYMLMQYRCI